MYLYKCLLIRDGKYTGTNLELWADSKAIAMKRLKAMLPLGIGWEIQKVVDTERYQKFAQL